MSHREHIPGSPRRQKSPTPRGRVLATESTRMRTPSSPRSSPFLAPAAMACALMVMLSGPPLRSAEQAPVTGDFRFSSGVELVNVTATVSDGHGRFVTGLTQDDFIVYEDGRPQTITHFSAERVPVSLGVAVDTSGSMEGEKIAAARAALERFLSELLDPEDELFLYRFSDRPTLLQWWTVDRQLLARAVDRLEASGGTAMYDAMAEALPIAAEGRHPKKAIVIISDGNDTASRIEIADLKARVRQSEVLVYAIGIDGSSEARVRRPWPPPMPPVAFPPGRGRWPPGGSPVPRDLPAQVRLEDRVNPEALRELTDDSGGRTEIIRSASDLEPATAGIADELSRQYYLGYPASGARDGRWREIRVEVKNPEYQVRARRGYAAS
jgi:Ca-activated chloride channel homolog